MASKACSHHKTMEADRALRRNLQQLPFLRSLCWQGPEENMDILVDRPLEEILAIYERGWCYRGAIADLSLIERQFIHPPLLEVSILNTRI